MLLILVKPGMGTTIGTTTPLPTTMVPLIAPNCNKFTQKNHSGKHLIFIISYNPTRYIFFFKYIKKEAMVLLIMSHPMYSLWIGLAFLPYLPYLSSNRNISFFFLLLFFESIFHFSYHHWNKIIISIRRKTNEVWSVLFARTNSIGNHTLLENNRNTLWKIWFGNLFNEAKMTLDWVVTGITKNKSQWIS